jgi:hypothetical protein
MRSLPPAMAVRVRLRRPTVRRRITRKDEGAVGTVGRGCFIPDQRILKWRLGTGPHGGSSSLVDNRRRPCEQPGRDRAGYPTFRFRKRVASRHCRPHRTEGRSIRDSLSADGRVENGDVVRSFRCRWRLFLLLGSPQVRDVDRALGMDPRWRIDGVIADRAAFPQRIHDGGVSVVGEHQSLRRSEKSSQTSGSARTRPGRFHETEG